MLDTSRLTLFLITAFVILVTPGPAVLYIIARSVDQGRLAGIVSTLGVGIGTMFHVAAAALFFLAFLPQFIDVPRGHATLQMILLGLLFVVMGIFSDGVWALFAGSAGSWLKNHLGFLRAQRYFSGSVFIALGVIMAVSGQNRK